MRVITFVHLLIKQIIIIPHDNVKAVISPTVMCMHMCMYACVCMCMWCVHACVCECVPVNEREMILLYSAHGQGWKGLHWSSGLRSATELSAFIEQSQNREPSSVLMGFQRLFIRNRLSQLKKQISLK